MPPETCPVIKLDNVTIFTAIEHLEILDMNAQVTRISNGDTYTGDVCRMHSLSNVWIPEKDGSFSGVELIIELPDISDWGHYEPPEKYSDIFIRGKNKADRVEPLWLFRKFSQWS